VLAVSQQLLLVQTAKDELPHWSAPYRAGATGLSAISCAQSFSLPGAGSERWMALVEFDAQGIDQVISAIISRSGDAKPFLFSAAGDLLMVPSHPREEGSAPEAGARSFADALANLPLEKEVRFFDHSNQGLPVLAAVRRVEIDHGPLLYASMVAPISTLAASTTRLVHGALLIEIAAVLIAVAVAWLLTRMLIHQRRQVQQARRSANAARARLEAMGSYRLVKRLGVGGMGEIWQAEHHLLARPAALKLISMDALASTEAERAETRHRFAREARATARLHSPNTVTVYDFGFSRDGAFFYAMELLDGLDLELLVQAHGAQPAARVISILLQVCRSLAEAHQLGLVHRDIKPANIYLCRLGLEVDVVKVLDFGLVADCKGAARAVSGGLIQGTPAFMAPEQAKGLYADARSDLYALGCVAYWLLSGRTLFEEADSYRMLHKQVHELPPPLDEVAKGAIPAGLGAIITSLLDKDPDRRPPTSLAVIAALEAIPIAADDAWPPARARAWWTINHRQPAPASPTPPIHHVASITISDPLLA
jgi:serine/threonine protein kinase